MQDTGSGAAPHTVAAAQGWNWIAEGFALFKRAPGIWIGMFVVWIVIYAVLNLIPLGGLVTALLGAVFMAGWMLGCRSLDGGGELKFEHLFAAFKGGQTGQLILLGALYLVGGIVIVLVAGLFVGGSLMPMMMGKVSAEDFHFGIGLVLGMLLAAALFVPLAMAFWFAPALVVFRQVQPVEAMKQSFAACVQNLAPFLLYGLVLLVLAILASIPLGLGWLVLGPVLIASVYTGYRDIFGDSAPASAAGATA